MAYVGPAIFVGVYVFAKKCVVVYALWKGHAFADYSVLQQVLKYKSYEVRPRPC